MKVAVFQQFLGCFAQPLKESGATSPVLKNIDRVQSSLMTFAEMDFEAFADFLGKAEEYHRTGILPAASSGGRKKAAPAVDQAAVDELIGIVNRLIDRAGQPGANMVEIDGEFKKLDKSGRLPKDVAIAVAKGVGVVKNVKTKKDALTEISERMYLRFRSVS